MNRKTVLFLVFSILLFFICISLFFTTYFSQKNNNNDIYYNNIIVDVVMSSVSENGANLLIEDKNLSDIEDLDGYSEYDWKKKYKVQKKMPNGWEDLDIIAPIYKISYDEEISKINILYHTLIKIDWTKLYGKLPKGTYRIVQYASNSKKEFYSNPFELPKKEIEVPPMENEEFIERHNNVTIDVLLNSITSTGVKLFIQDKNGVGNNYHKYYWDYDYYDIQVKKDNEWELVETKSLEYERVVMGVGTSGDFVTLQLDFTKFYNPLPNGTYRIKIGEETSTSAFYSNEFKIKDIYQ